MKLTKRHLLVGVMVAFLASFVTSGPGHAQGNPDVYLRSSAVSSDAVLKDLAARFDRPARELFAEYCLRYREIGRPFADYYRAMVVQAISDVRTNPGFTFIYNQLKDNPNQFKLQAHMANWMDAEMARGVDPCVSKQATKKPEGSLYSKPKGPSTYQGGPLLNAKKQKIWCLDSKGKRKSFKGVSCPNGWQIDGGAVQ